MKAKLLSFTFIYFLESGVFKGLRLIHIKKLVPLRLASKVVLRAPSKAFTGLHAPRRHDEARNPFIDDL